MAVLFAEGRTQLSFLGFYFLRGRPCPIRELLVLILDDRDTLDDSYLAEVFLLDGFVLCLEVSFSARQVLLYLGRVHLLVKDHLRVVFFDLGLS